MDKLFIRKAELVDVNTAATLHRQSAIAAYGKIFPPAAAKPTPESLAKRWQRLLTRHDSLCAVAVAETGESAGQIVGALAAAPTDDDTALIWLHMLYVRPAWWGRGAGSGLHRCVLERARSVGAKEMRLWVLEPNVSARRMCERWGWTLVPGERLANGDTGIDDVQYRLVL